MKENSQEASKSPLDVSNVLGSCDVSRTEKKAKINWLLFRQYDSALSVYRRRLWQTTRPKKLYPATTKAIVQLKTTFILLEVKCKSHPNIYGFHSF